MANYFSKTVIFSNKNGSASTMPRQSFPKLKAKNDENRFPVIREFILNRRLGKLIRIFHVNNFVTLHFDFNSILEFIKTR